MYTFEKEKNTIELCANCESLSANSIDNIDETADMILERIRRRR